MMSSFPANIYLFKFNNRNTRKKYEIYSKLTIRHQNDVNLTRFSNVSIVEFEQENVFWVWNATKIIFKSSTTFSLIQKC